MAYDTWMENLLVYSSTLFIVFFMGTLSYLTNKYETKGKLQSKNNDNEVNKSNNESLEKYKKRHQMISKNNFIHRPSILDSGMEVVIPWRNNSNIEKNNLLKKSIFRGWYNLIWLMLLSYVITQFMSNYVSYGHFIFNIKYFYSLLMNLHELVLSLFPIYFFSFSSYVIQSLMIYTQKLFVEQLHFQPSHYELYIRYPLTIIQHILQTIMIFGVGAFVYLYCHHWPFTQKLALTMETLALYMKMHSYLLSNEELYQMKYKQNNKNNNEDDFKILQMQDVDRLSDDEVIEELKSRGFRDFDSLVDSSAFFCFFAQSLPSNEVYMPRCLSRRNSNRNDKKNTNSTNNGNKSDISDNNENPSKENDANNNVFEKKESSSSISLNSDNNSITSELSTDKTSIHDLHAKIKELKQIEAQQQRVHYLRMILKDALFMENYRRTIYPQNVTLWNFFEFTCLPTLVYEPLYPRTSSIRIAYVIEKLLFTIFLTICNFTIVEKFILTVFAKMSELSAMQCIIQLSVPMILIEILTFFLVFDCILNCVAEITCFADREFYQDWWNSCSFEEFARKWNRPVHEFLLRHIYYESMNHYKFDRNLATVGTFIFSIALHEVVLSACMHRFTPWLAGLSLFQIPLMPIMKSPVFKNKPLGNITFWSSIIFAVPLIIVLYARGIPMDLQ